MDGVSLCSHPLYRIYLASTLFIVLGISCWRVYITSLTGSLVSLGAGGAPVPAAHVAQARSALPAASPTQVSSRLTKHKTHPHDLRPQVKRQLSVSVGVACHESACDKV